MHSPLYLGAKRSIRGNHNLGPFELNAHDLVTHAVIVGMTGSGKTGLVTVMVEEALRAGIPALIVDVKGDLPNLMLAFPTFDPAHMTPWVEPAVGDADGIADPHLVEAAVARRKEELLRWQFDESKLADYAARTLVRVVTPGSDAGEPLHLLSALERRSHRWDHDVEGARSTLSAAISLVLRLTGRDGDPGRSREHALLSVLAETRLLGGRTAAIAELLPEILLPPIAEIGALPVEAFISERQRSDLAADLNTLIASPTMAAWRKGQDLDVGRWMEPVNGRTPATIVSVAHLDDDERTMVLGVLLEEVLTWVRSLPGTSRLRALIVFDEVYGFIPPHPANPATKKPLDGVVGRDRAVVGKHHELTRRSHPNVPCTVVAAPHLDLAVPRHADRPAVGIKGQPTRDERGERGEAPAVPGRAEGAQLAAPFEVERQCFARHARECIPAVLALHRRRAREAASFRASLDPGTEFPEPRPTCVK